MVHQILLVMKPGQRGEARLRSMVEGHFDAVWRAVRRLGVPEALADDATQQVFVVAARRLGEIECGRERPYLFGIALKVASDARRALQRRREVPFEKEADVADRHACALDEILDEKRAREALGRILDHLPSDLREAFVLFELEELTAPQVAELLRIRVGTVASRVRRARAAIRQSLLRKGAVHE